MDKSLNKHSTTSADLQNQLIGALIGLARSIDGNEDLVTPETDELILQSLLSAHSASDIPNADIHELLDRILEEKKRFVPGCFYCTASCGRTDDYDMNLLQSASEDIRHLKSLLLFSAYTIAVYTFRAFAKGLTDMTISRFLYKALYVIGMDCDCQALLPIIQEAGEIHLRCAQLVVSAYTP